MLIDVALNECETICRIKMCATNFEYMLRYAKVGKHESIFILSIK